MGDLCGKSMSQSASAMSIKQQPASKPEKGETSQDEASDGIKVQPEEAFPRVSKKAISSSTNLPSDANNNTTAGSVKILVEPASNDITPSNSQEFLLQQQRQSSSPTSSRSSQQTSPIHRRALMQQSRSTSNITSLTGPSGASLTKEQLIKSQPTTTRTGGEKVAYLCHCPASGGTLNAKHRTRRRKSWSSYSSNELPTSAKTPSFSPYSNVQQSDQNASRSSQQEKFDQIKAQLEYCLDQKVDENSANLNGNPPFAYKDESTTRRLSGSDDDVKQGAIDNFKFTKGFQKEPINVRASKSELASPAAGSSAANSASSLCALEANLSEHLSGEDGGQSTNLEQTNSQQQPGSQLAAHQQWHEKPRSLSASSGEAFYYQQQQQHLAKTDTHSPENSTFIACHHYAANQPHSVGQAPYCCCYNSLYHANHATDYSRSNSGSSSHNSISVSQLSISTSTAAISSLGSMLSSTPNAPAAQQPNAQLTTTTQVTLVATTTSNSINQQQQQQQITTSIISSSSTTTEGQRSRSATGCLFTGEQTVDPATVQQPSPQTTPPPGQTQPQRSSPPVGKRSTARGDPEPAVEEPEQSALRHAKSQKQSRRPSNNRLANESTPESNRSMRSRNLLLAHQLHKSISTPTLVVHEEPSPSQSSERSSALSRIKSKFTGNSSNSNISAIKAGTSLFSTVRDKLLQHENLALTCAPESDDERASAKPKKRSSLFFRKKKSKDTVRKSAHQFVSVSYSIANAWCDVCKKPLVNKAALHCENCLITVHDSSCRDQILDCNRFSLAKKPNQLTLQVPGSVGNLTTVGLKTGGGSSPTHGQQQQNVPGSPLNASVSSLSATVNQTVSSANLLSNLTGMSNVKTLIETGSAGYSTPLGVTPATSPSASYAQLHPSSSISLNPVAATSSFRKGHHPSASIGSFSSSDSTCSLQSKANASLSPSTSRRSYTPSAYKSWRRVAEKLGVNKVICEDKEAEDNASIIVEVNSTSSESLEEDQSTYTSLVFDDDQLLRLSEDEPASYSLAVSPNLLKSMKEKEIKRQEAIYELILTEKHHCLTMKIMQKVYMEGMMREVGLPKDDVDRIFPCLAELLDLHLGFLRKLRERQAKNEIIPSISDILLAWLSGKNSEKLRNYYGQFCSQHKEAVFLYKDYLKTDRKFQAFIKSCMSKPYCKTRGVTECILLVTQRISKYPLIIESLIKLDKALSKQLSLQLNQDLLTANIEKLIKVEISELDQCFVNIRQIIFNVDDQVAEKEREHRLLKIYNKIDAKSTATMNGKKFRKSDLLSDKRKLQFETICTYRNPHSKQAKNAIDCLLIILSDVIVFLQENNQKYYFAPIDNKSSVISLQNLIVREKAGQSSKGIFLISTNKKENEMYELHFSTIKDQKQLIGQLNYTMALNQFEGTNSEISLTDNALMAWRLGIASPACRLSSRRLELNELINELHNKDKQLAAICEEKIRLLAELLETQGIVQVSESAANFADALQLISYSNLLNDACSQETLLSATNEAYRIVQNLYLTSCNLSRSVSSAGEHQSDQFINPPILPKRAETFAGFDHNAAALSRLLQKFTSNSNVIAQTTSTTTITTCSPSTVTTNTIIDKLVEDSKEASDGQEVSQDRKSVSSDDKQIDAVEETVESNQKPEPEKPSILVNTVLPMQDPNDLVSQLSILPLLVSQLEHSRGSVDSELSVSIPQSKHEQVIQIVELQHQLNLLLCLFHHQQTLFELMRLSLQESRSLPTSASAQAPSTSASTLALNTLSTSLTISPSKSASTSGNALHHSMTNMALPKSLAENQLEELRSIRNLQEQFSAEKQSFETRTRELERREEQLKLEKNDLVEQREHLFRKLENLQDEFGICMLGSGSSASAKLANIQASLNLGRDEGHKSEAGRSTRARLSSGDLQVKQQIPLKLATGNNQLGSSMSKSCNNSPNISPSITGSFDPMHCFQSKPCSKKSSVSYSSSTATPTSPKSIKVAGSRKQSNQSDQPAVDESSGEDKNEEEIFC